MPTQVFNYDPPFPGVVANGSSTFSRSFHHRNWVDGQDLVQAGETPDEEGVNARLHALERDLDAVKADLVNSFRLIGELRSALAIALEQARVAINSKPDKASTKEGKEKDTKESKEGKDGKEGKDSKDQKDGKEGKDSKEHKDGKETKERKEDKDGKEGGKDHAAKEKDEEHPPRHELVPPAMLTGSEPAPAPVGRPFIRHDERPCVGERILARDPDAGRELSR